MSPSAQMVVDVWAALFVGAVVYAGLCLSMIAVNVYRLAQDYYRDRCQRRQVPPCLACSESPPRAVARWRRRP